MSENLSGDENKIKEQDFHRRQQFREQFLFNDGIDRRINNERKFK